MSAAAAAGHKTPSRCRVLDMILLPSPLRLSCYQDVNCRSALTPQNFAVIDRPRKLVNLTLLQNNAERQCRHHTSVMKRWSSLAATSSPDMILDAAVIIYLDLIWLLV